MMKKMKTIKILVLALCVMILTALPTFAHQSDVSFNLPAGVCTFEIDTNIDFVDIPGTLTHNPGNVTNFQICLSDESGLNLVDCINTGAQGNKSNFQFSFSVELEEGDHALTVTARKGGSDPHMGTATRIVTVCRSNVVCDDKAPPAYANQYLKDIKIDNKEPIHGSILSAIANNHAGGKYGKCTYDQACIEDDIEALLDGRALSSSCGD